MDKKGLKGLYLRYLFDLYQNGVITSDKNDELADKFDEIDMTDNNKVNSFETYIRDCIKNDKYNEKELKTLLDKCKKPNTNTNSSINNVMDLIKEISKLNPTVKFNLSNNNTIQPTLESVEDVNNLILPQGFTYNDKNGINNKHNTSTGNYITLDYKQVKPVKKQTNNTNNIGGNIMTIKELREEIEKLNPTVKFRFYGEDIVSDCVLTSKENPSKLVLPQGFTYDKKIGIVNADNTLYMPYHQITAPSQRRHNKLVKAFRNLLNKNNSAKMPGAVPVRTTRKHRGLRALFDKLTGKRARNLNIAPTQPTQPVNKGKELAEFMRANGLLNNKEVKDYIALINQSQDKNAKFTELYNYVKNNPDEAKDLNNMLNKLAQITGVPRKGVLPKMPQKKTLNPNKPITKDDLIKNKEDYNLEMIKYIANLKDKNLPRNQREVDFNRKIDAFRKSVENSNKSNSEKIELMRMITVYLANQDRIDYVLDNLTKNEAKLAILNSDKKLQTKFRNYQKQLANANTRATAAVVEYNNRIANKATAEELQKANEKMLKTNNEVKKIEKRIKETEEMRKQIFDKMTYIYGTAVNSTFVGPLDYKRMGYDETEIKANIAKSRKLLSDVVSKDTKVSNIQPSKKAQAKFAKLKANAAKRDAQAYKDIADVKAGKLVKRPDRPMSKIK